MGVVFDAALRTPVSGAKVTIRIPNSTLTTDDDEIAIDPLTGEVFKPMITGSDGRYLLPAMAPGNYYIFTEAPSGYASTYDGVNT